MADASNPLLDRATALLAGPLLLGRQALGFLFSPEPPEPPASAALPTASRITVTPPEHAIKRRG